MTGGGEDLAGAWRALLSRHATVFSALEAELQRRHDIGVHEFEALQSLANGPDQCRATDLTGAIPLSQSATSRLVARLEREGLVQRALCQNDRRGVYVTLTEAGRQRYEQARPTQHAVLAATLTDG